MNKHDIITELQNRKDRSAWDKGVTGYAMDLLEQSEHDEITRYSEKDLLNGADSWNQYSYGGCAAIYDADIAAALCSPSELKRKRGGELQPNSRESWLDVQARALTQAWTRIKRIAIRAERKQKNDSGRLVLFDGQDERAVIYPDGVRWFKSLIGGEERRHESKELAEKYIRNKGFIYTAPELTPDGEEWE